MVKILQMELKDFVKEVSNLSPDLTPTEREEFLTAVPQSERPIAEAILAVRNIDTAILRQIVRTREVMESAHITQDVGKPYGC